MSQEMSPRRPTTRRYSEAEKERAVRAVRLLRRELGTDHGTIKRVADQLGIGTESLRVWVKRSGAAGAAKVDGLGTTQHSRAGKVRPDQRVVGRPSGAS